jgi:hypothetical protein
MTEQSNKNEGDMAAEAIDVADRAKWDAYEAQVAKRPKQDRRAFAAAGPQTQFVIVAVTQWYEWFMDAANTMGLPKENVLYRAALLIPRAPSGSAAAPMLEPPKVVAAIEKAVADMQASRSRALIANERWGHLGLERVSRHLGESVDCTKRLLKQARDSIASHLRGAGWRVPNEE